MNKKLFLCLILSYTLLANCINAQTNVTFYTSMGNFVVELYDAKRPITTQNFISLVNKKFYDGIIFHRVIKDFMIQGGDPTGTGSGGSGVKIKDEFTPNLSNIVKTISMANSGPNTGTSQFFINVKNNTSLDTKHPVFGIVINNYTVVEAISKVPTSSEKPKTPVVMDSVRITSATTNVAQVTNELLTIAIYPNPATATSTVLINSATEKKVTASIYNQQGQLVYVANKNITNGYVVISLEEVKDWSNFTGLYYLIITDGKIVVSKKFIFGN